VPYLRNSEASCHVLEWLPPTQVKLLPPASRLVKEIGRTEYPDFIKWLVCVNYLGRKRAVF